MGLIREGRVNFRLGVSVGSISGVTRMFEDRLKEKASKLLERGRVESLSEGVFNVIGDHGTYTVVKDYTGKVSCD